jgi:hypothetical protein
VVLFFVFGPNHESSFAPHRANPAAADRERAVGTAAIEGGAGGGGGGGEVFGSAKCFSRGVADRGRAAAAQSRRRTGGGGRRQGEPIRAAALGESAPTENRWPSPHNPQKSELVVSRFTLLGHLRPGAGKSGPFLLHGG